MEKNVNADKIEKAINDAIANISLEDDYCLEEKDIEAQKVLVLKLKKDKDHDRK